MAPGSRRSVRSSTPIPMPVIAEDENSLDRRDGATTPTVPPRSPHRRPSTTRSSSYMGSSTHSNNSSLYPPLTRPSLSRSSSVPQYVPKPKRVPGIRAVGGEVGSVRSIPLNSNGSERWVIPQNLTDRGPEGALGGSPRPLASKEIGKSGDERGERGGKEKDSRALGGWVRRSKGGWYKIVVLVILIVGLIVGLAVGLTVGLRKRYIFASFCSTGNDLYRKERCPRVPHIHTH